MERTRLTTAGAAWSDDEVWELVDLFERRYFETDFCREDAVKAFRQKFPSRTKWTVRLRFIRLEKGIGVAFRLLILLSNGET